MCAMVERGKFCMFLYHARPQAGGSQELGCMKVSISLKDVTNLRSFITFLFHHNTWWEDGKAFIPLDPRKHY